MKIRFFLLFFTLLMANSCHQSDKNTQLKTVFRYNEPVGITSLDPAFSKDKAKIWVCNQIYNGLIQLDENLYPKPCIAKYWDIDQEGLLYTFYLRDDVFFHDHDIFKNRTGRRVVADDFVYSFLRIVDPAIASPGSWVFNNVYQDAQGEYAFYAIDDTTFQIRLKKPFPPFLSLLSMQYCSVVPHEIVGFYGKDFRKNPVGTGPFTFKFWKEGVKLILVKNENYFEYNGSSRLPYLDAVAITFIKDQQSAFLEFIKSNLDFYSGIHPSFKDEVLTKAGKLRKKYKNRFKMLSQPYLNTEYLGILIHDSLPIAKNSPTADLRVRQAINYGFDRKKMMKYLRNNIGYPGLSGMIPHGLPGYDSLALYGYDYQPDKARELLKRAGYDQANKPAITLSTVPEYLDLCKFIQHQLNEIGFDIQIEVSPSATLRENVAQSKVVFFRASWIADYPDAENYLSLFYSKNFSPAGPNYTHFSNKTYDSLYEIAAFETSDSLRINYYRMMDSIVMQQAPVIVLYYDQVVRLVQHNIYNIGSNPMNLLTLKYVKKRNE